MTDWRSEEQRRDTLQTHDEIAVMVAHLPYRHREALRAWLLEKQQEDALDLNEAASLEQFRRELNGAAPWIREANRPLAIRIIRAFTERV